MKNNKSLASSIGACDVLGIAFVVLRLCGIIKWSWVFVTMPFWLPLVIAIVILALIKIIFGVAK